MRSLSIRGGNIDRDCIGPLYGEGGGNLCLRPETITLRPMSKHLASVLTTVNAPCSVQLDDAALADCFADLDLAKQHPAHVSAFLGEVLSPSKSSSQPRTTFAVDEMKALPPSSLPGPAKAIRSPRNGWT